MSHAQKQLLLNAVAVGVTLIPIVGIAAPLALSALRGPAFGTATRLQWSATIIRGGSGEVGAARFGGSVAISADGSTVLVGAPGDDKHRGAVFVFVRAGSTWKQEGPKLTGGGPVFALSVSLSGDGNVALVGAPGYAHEVGSAWVFRRANGNWGPGIRLRAHGESGAAEFGWVVALSADGKTALIGAPDDNKPPGYSGNLGAGAAWIFREHGASWVQQGSKLTGRDETPLGDFGAAVALSADGETALIGGFYANNAKGRAWVFTRRSDGWKQQGPALNPDDKAAQPQFGADVALSANGDTALVSGPGDDNLRGAVWAYTRTGTTWEQDGKKLVPADTKPVQFGGSIALSANATIAVIGGVYALADPGTAWIFRHATRWAQEGPAIRPIGAKTPSNGFGATSAISADGNTFVIGGGLDNHRHGAVWIYARRLG